MDLASLDDQQNSRRDFILPRFLSPYREQSTLHKQHLRRSKSKDVAGLGSVAVAAACDGAFARFSPCMDFHVDLRDGFVFRVQVADVATRSNQNFYRRTLSFTRVFIRVAGNGREEISDE